MRRSESFDHKVIRLIITLMIILVITVMIKFAMALIMTMTILVMMAFELTIMMRMKISQQNHLLVLPVQCHGHKYPQAWHGSEIMPPAHLFALWEIIWDRDLGKVLDQGKVSPVVDGGHFAGQGLASGQRPYIDPIFTNDPPTGKTICKIQKFLLKNTIVRNAKISVQSKS